MRKQNAQHWPTVTTPKALGALRQTHHEPLTQMGIRLPAGGLLSVYVLLEAFAVRLLCALSICDIVGCRT